jgi:hypothetical protein
MILNVWLAGVDEALELPHLGASLLNFLRLVIDVLIFSITRELLLKAWLVELLERQSLRAGNNDFVVLSLADGALAILHDKSEAQDAKVAHILVVAAAQSEVLHVIKAEDAVLFVRQIDF